MSLKQFDISNCGSLRDLQLRMLERPIAELEAGRATSKVHRQALACPVPPSVHSVRIKLACACHSPPARLSGTLCHAKVLPIYITPPHCQRTG